MTKEFKLNNELVTTDPKARQYAEECLPHFQAILDIALKTGVRRQARLEVFLAFLAGDAVLNDCPRKIFKQHCLYAFDWAKKESSRRSLKTQN